MDFDSWSVEFQFKVTHKGHMCGDGFAFWYLRSSNPGTLIHGWFNSDERAQSGPVFGGPDKWTGFGLFFDEYPNRYFLLLTLASKKYINFLTKTHPTVMGVINDGTISYDHDNDGKDQDIGSCFSVYQNMQTPTSARVTYIHQQGIKVRSSFITIIG